MQIDLRSHRPATVPRGTTSAQLGPTLELTQTAQSRYLSVRAFRVYRPADNWLLSTCNLPLHLPLWADSSPCPTLARGPAGACHTPSETFTSDLRAVQDPTTVGSPASRPAGGVFPEPKSRYLASAAGSGPHDTAGCRPLCPVFHVEHQSAQYTATLSRQPSPHLVSHGTLRSVPRGTHAGEFPSPPTRVQAPRSTCASPPLDRQLFHVERQPSDYVGTISVSRSPSRHLLDPANGSTWNTQVQAAAHHPT